MPDIQTYFTWRKLPASTLGSDSAMKVDWDRLNASRLDLPFMCADAMTAALAVFGSGLERLLIAQSGGRTVAMFLMVPDGTLRWRTFQPSQLPLGTWVAEPVADLAAICRSAMRGPLSPCLAISITQVDPLQAERPAEAPDLRSSDYIDTAWVEISGSFDDFWAARGKNLRQNMRKQRNKLAADGVAAEMRVLRNLQDMAPAIARYGELESAGWKSGRGTAIHPDNEQGRFYTRLLEDAARRGEALAFEYLLGGRTAAMNFGLLRSGVWTVLKTTYDESLPKTLSPAFLLREEELQYLHGTQEVRRIEYYGRLMDWHTKLTDARRILFHLTVYRWPVVKRWAMRRRKPAPVDHAGAEVPQVQ
ncbi:MAG: hypothetical protein ABT20_03390 [Rubrivivax sp. SCN 70-15]|nr:MAG: hypothetical protein ABT20_03390 [Rubrivivax sp. SCN 70-15]